MDFIPNKRCKTENDNTDIISNLPRDVLCHILSFLPTKYAAGTSILSTKWKNLLPLIPCLQLLLEDTHLLHPHPPSNTHLITFQNFVHNLLNVTLRDTPSIHSLTLICHEINDGQLIASWIIAALRLNIKWMDIQIQRLQNLKFLIDSLYGSNLVSLRLCLSFSHDATAFKDFKFSLPKLKRLSVQSMGFTLVNALLASCPMLRYLMLIDCYSFHPEERLQIRIPSLMYVELLNTLCWVNYLVDIDAPQLLYMSHWGYIASRNVNRTKYNKIWVGYLTYENNASRYTYYFDEKTAMLGKAFYGADVLWLSEACILMMLRQPHHLPRFEKMDTLCVTYMTVHGWKLLPSLIDSAPNLRNLCIRNVSDIKLFKSLKASVLDSVPIRLVKRTNRFYNFYIERK